MARSFVTPHNQYINKQKYYMSIIVYDVIKRSILLLDNKYYMLVIYKRHNDDSAAIWRMTSINNLVK